MKTYQSPFTDPIMVDNQKRAFYVLTHFCDYCHKDSVGRYHCSWASAKLCEETKDQIRKDWYKSAGI